MKTTTRKLAARPARNMSIILLSIALMMFPLNTFANDNDEDLRLEEWMTIPFEREFAEAEMLLEDWMTIPFVNDMEDSEMQVEEWMTESWI